MTLVLSRRWPHHMRRPTLDDAADTDPEFRGAAMPLLGAVWLLSANKLAASRIGGTSAALDWWNGANPATQPAPTRGELV